jgi:hypothetical protein
MCRALQVLCVATGKPSLDALKRATVAQEWELIGAVGSEEAMVALKSGHPHVLVVWGSFADVVREARASFPGLRIVAVGRDPIEEADVSITSISGVRDAILGTPPVGGPVRS